MEKFDSGETLSKEQGLGLMRKRLRGMFNLNQQSAHFLTLTLCHIFKANTKGPQVRRLGFSQVKFRVPMVVTTTELRPQKSQMNH